MKEVIPINLVVSKVGTRDSINEWMCDLPSLEEVIEFILQSKHERNAIHVGENMKVKNMWGEILLALAKRDHCTHVTVNIQI